jgi:hypothetical protein
MTAFDDQGENEIAPASFYKLRHQRRLLRTTVFMGGKSPFKGGNVKRARAVFPRVVPAIAGTHTLRPVVKAPWLTPFETISIGGHGSRRSPGRRIEALS